MKKNDAISLCSDIRKKGIHVWVCENYDNKGGCSVDFMGSKEKFEKAKARADVVKFSVSVIDRVDFKGKKIKRFV